MTRPALLRAARVVIPLLLLWWLAARWGGAPFADAVRVLSPFTVAAALVLGGVATVAHAMRWRVVIAGLGAAEPSLTTVPAPARAIQEYYRSTFLNCVLPTGVAGDVLRAWRHSGDRPGAGPGLRHSATAVLVERCIGAALLLLIGAALLAGRHPPAAVSLAMAGAVPALAAMPGFRKLTGLARLATLGWSALSVSALLGLYLVAAARLGTVTPGVDSALLGLVTLAGMAIPVGFGGYGPKEVIAAAAFMAAGSTPQAGIATSVGYGLLALVSALPGALALVVDRPTAPPNASGQHLIGTM